MPTFRTPSTPVSPEGASSGPEAAAIGVQAWAESHRLAWTQSLKGLRMGALKTFETRNGRQIDTTFETIA